MYGATIKIIHFQYFKCVWNLISQILGGLWENRVPQRKLLPEWDGGWEGCKNVHDINFVVCLSQKKKVAPPKGALLRVWEFVSNFVYCNYSYDILYSQTQDKKKREGTNKNYDNAVSFRGHKTKRQNLRSSHFRDRQIQQRPTYRILV